MFLNLGRGLWVPIAVAAVAAICTLAVTRGLGNLSHVQDELQQVLQTNQRLEKENRAMYRQVSRLRGDTQALERACRRDMGVVRPDEVVYQPAVAPPRPLTGKEQP